MSWKDLWRLELSSLYFSVLVMIFVLIRKSEAFVDDFNARRRTDSQRHDTKTALIQRQKAEVFPCLRQK